MLNFKLHSFHNPSHRLMWYGLAFQAGAINAGGFLSTHSFVSHVTGFGTMIGVNLAVRNVLTAIELLLVPLSFLTGAVFSALMIERPKMLGKIPRYPIVMGTMAILLNIILILGVTGWFGEFGEELITYQDIILLAILSFTCGTQNSAIYIATRGTIRTTHMTGTITDIGIHLVKIKSLPKESKARPRELLMNITRIFTFISFSIGSTVSAMIFSNYKFAGFAMPAATATVFFVVSLKFAYSSNRKREILADAALGSQPMLSISDSG